MEILQLRYFCDAAQSGNFSKTAKKHNVPASNISQTVKRLESEVGVSLFDRTANRIMLNENGREFYKRIKAALEKIDEARAMLSDSANGVSGEIRMKICTNRRVVTDVIERFRRLYPNVDFTLSHNINDEGSFDLLVADDLTVMAGYERRLIIKERILLAAEKSSAASKAKSVKELENERFITMPRGSSMYRYTHDICRGAGFEPHIAIESDDPYYIRKYLDMGLGIAFVPSVSWKGQYGENVVCRDICGMERSTYVYRSTYRYTSRATAAFLDLLGEVCDTL